MKRYILPAIAALFAITSCGDLQQEVTPSDIDNLRVESKEGAITLKWDLPADRNYLYVKVEYTNPRTKEKCKRLASSYTDSLHVDGLLAKDGEFIFSVCSVSSTNTPGKEHIISGTADPVVPIYTTFSEQVSLTTNMLSANASELQGEGNLASLIDGSLTTFYSTDWRNKPPFPHWVQFTLTEPVEAVRIIVVTRHNADYASPGNTSILVSTDGNNWESIGTIPEGAVPAAKGAEYESEVFESETPFTMLRYSVNTGQNQYWGLAEFQLWKVWYDVYDPENQ